MSQFWGSLQDPNQNSEKVCPPHVIGRRRDRASINCSWLIWAAAFVPHRSTRNTTDASLKEPEGRIRQSEPLEGEGNAVLKNAPHNRRSIVGRVALTSRSVVGLLRRGKWRIRSVCVRRAGGHDLEIQIEIRANRIDTFWSDRTKGGPRGSVRASCILELCRIAGTVT